MEIYTKLTNMVLETNGARDVFVPLTEFPCLFESELTESSHNFMFSKRERVAKRMPYTMNIVHEQYKLHHNRI